MSKNIKVSVVVAVYNVAPYLRQCLDSLCGQTLKQIEIICVDDGSTDASFEILKEYEWNYPQVRVLENKVKGFGAAHARNMGLDSAVGDFVLVVDSDDYFDVTMAEKTYKKAVETGAEVVWFDTQEFDNLTLDFFPSDCFFRSYLFPNKKVFSVADCKDCFFQLGLPVAWNKLVKRSVIETKHLRFREAPVADDLYFAYSALFSAESICMLPEKLVFYRSNNANSQSRKKDLYPLRGLETVLEVKGILEERGLFSLVESSFFPWSLEVCTWYLDACLSSESFRRIFSALQEGGLEEIGFSPKTEGYLSPREKSLLDFLRSEPFTEAVFFQYQSRVGVMGSLLRYPFPQQAVKKQDKVILYGAGTAGKALYAQNIIQGFCHIVAWVDGNYERLQGPVEGLEAFQTHCPDKVVIAIENQKIAKKVAEELKTYKIAEENFIFI